MQLIGPDTKLIDHPNSSNANGLDPKESITVGISCSGVSSFGHDAEIMIDSLEPVDIVLSMETDGTLGIERRFIGDETHVVACTVAAPAGRFAGEDVDRSEEASHGEAEKSTGSIWFFQYIYIYIYMCVYIYIYKL